MKGTGPGTDGKFRVFITLLRGLAASAAANKALSVVHSRKCTADALFELGYRLTQVEGQDRFRKLYVQGGESRPEMDPDPATGHPDANRHWPRYRAGHCPRGKQRLPHLFRDGVLLDITNYIDADALQPASWLQPQGSNHCTQNGLARHRILRGHATHLLQRGHLRGGGNRAAIQRTRIGFGVGPLPHRGTLAACEHQRYPGRFRPRPLVPRIVGEIRAREATILRKSPSMTGGNGSPLGLVCCRLLAPPIRHAEGPEAGQPKSRVQARIGASRAGLRPILSRSSPMDKSGLQFC